MKYNTIEIPNYLPSSHPFAMFFVYPRDREPFIVKGTSNDCHTYLNKFNTPCFYRYTYWKLGYSRGGWMTNMNMYINNCKFVRDIPTCIMRHRGVYGDRKNGYNIEIYDENNEKVIRHFRRMPHKWVPEIESLYQILCKKNDMVFRKLDMV